MDKVLDKKQQRNRKHRKSYCDAFILSSLKLVEGISFLGEHLFPRFVHYFIVIA
jgi:hypothetical protein